MSYAKLILPAMVLSQVTLASPPDARAIEFFNATLGHYFVTASATEAAGVDSGGAGPGWIRTGRSFAVWVSPVTTPAGTAPVCRFYSSGANSHFFTASAAECESLAKLETTERAAAAAAGRVFSGWRFEGAAFSVLPAAPGAGLQKDASPACAPDSVAIFRGYNDGFTTGAGANHRLVDDSGLQELMVDRGWINEGIAFCAPTQADRSTASIPVVVAATAFPELAATWTGSAEWETKMVPAGAQTELRTALSVTIDSAGLVTGSGNGCTLSGRVEKADAARAFYTGTVGTAGCADALFNGANKLSIERTATGPLQFHFGRKTTSVETEVEAALGSAASPPAGGNSGGGNNGGGNSGGGNNGGGNNGGGNSSGGNNGSPFVLAGIWSSDTIQWTTTIRQGGQPDQTVTGSHSLSLTISTTNTVTGAGFGCVFTGSATPTSPGKGVFIASLEARGCTSPAFNGSYTNALLQAEDAGRLEVELERETEARGIKTRVKIAGTFKK